MGSFIWRTLRGDILRVAAAVAENKEIYILSIKNTKKLKHQKEN